MLLLQDLIKKHELVMADMEAFAATISSLEEQSKRCKVSINNSKSEHYGSTGVDPDSRGGYTTSPYIIHESQKGKFLH